MPTPKGTCFLCKGPTSSTRSKYCTLCYDKLRRTSNRKVCPICQGSKTARAKLCSLCFIRTRIVRNSEALSNFISLRVNKALGLKVKELGFTVEDLVELSNIPKGSIENWLYDKHVPRKVELNRLLKAIDFVRCEHCKGLGYVDGGDIE